MKLESLTISTAVILACIAGTALWISWCHDPKVRDEALLTVRGDTADAMKARLAFELVARQQEWDRTEKRQNREIAAQRHRADSLTQALASRVIVVAGDSLVPKVVADSAVAAEREVSAAAERQAAFYQMQVASYRDSLVPALQRLNAELTAQREAWKGQAQRPRYTLTDIGGAALAGYGVADENETLALAGAAIVVVPRVVRGLGHILGRIF